MGFRLKPPLQNEAIYARLPPQKDRQEIKQRREFSDSGGNRWMKLIPVPTQASARTGVNHDRVIPSPVKVKVWKTDKGGCVQRSSREDLHFDDMIPYSQDGRSGNVAKSQILCARRNPGKKDVIQ